MAILNTIKREWLAKYKEGLILLSGGRMGDVGQFLLRGNQALVNECLAFYEMHFPDNYYLELIRTGRPDEENYLHAAVELATLHGLPVVATNDVRFIASHDFDAHEIRVAIHDGFTLSDPKRPKNTALSNIYAVKPKCANCLPIFPKLWKIASKLLSVVT